MTTAEGAERTSETSAAVLGAGFGFGFGVFTSVDFALMTGVLPAALESCWLPTTASY